jgi:catechol 2,3-dioxygenase-like lactoylglutathione lyase family enzyme
VGLAHITLATRDVRRSADFFQDVLGWQPAARPGNIHTTAAWLEIAPGIELHLIEDPAFEPSRFEKEFGRHIAITLALAEFPQLKARLQARGARRDADRTATGDTVYSLLLSRPERLCLRSRRGRPRRAETGRVTFM